MSSGLLVKTVPSCRAAKAQTKTLKHPGSLGIEPGYGTPEEFSQVLLSDIERWGKLARAINLKLD